MDIADALIGLLLICFTLALFLPQLFQIHNKIYKRKQNRNNDWTTDKSFILIGCTYCGKDFNAIPESSGIYKCPYCHTSGYAGDELVDPKVVVDNNVELGIDK